MRYDWWKHKHDPSLDTTPLEDDIQRRTVSFGSSGSVELTPFRRVSVEEVGNEMSYIVVLREDQFERLREIVRKEVRDVLREELGS